MGNSIKYSEGSESLALNKGNWWIGTGDTNKGPTAESGYWNAINPPSGGYTVYLNKESNGPSIHSISNDEQLISFTNKISGNNYVNVAECLVYYQTQDDKLCVNREMENIVTDGLVLNLDAGYVSSYPTSGTTWYDLSGNGNDGTLINGPIYSGGSIVFDGVDDRTSLVPYNSTFNIRIGITLSCFFKRNSIFTQLSDTFILSRPPAWYFYDEYNIGFIRGDVFIDGVRRGVRRTSVPNDGKWYKIDYTYDSVSRFARIYKNGVLQSSTELTGLTNYLIDSSNANFLLIFGNSIGKSYFTSILSIYNRALTQQEILQNYNAQKSRFGL